MGNQTSKPPKSKKKHEAPVIDDMEIGLIDQIFHEMAVRSPNDTISKDTFMKFFDLPGVLGDRLFDVFDTKQTGEIDFEEFLTGYQKFARTDPKSKMEMMFQLFDLDNQGGITKDELRTVLLSIVTPPNQVMRNGGNVPMFGHRSSNLLNLKNTQSANNSANNSTTPLSPGIDRPTSNSSSHENSPKQGAVASPEPVVDDVDVGTDNTTTGNNNNNNNNNTSQQPATATLNPNDSSTGKPSMNLSTSHASIEAMTSVQGSTFSLHHQNMDNMYGDEVSEDTIGIEDIQVKVDEIVNKAFDECDTDESGRLDPVQFKEFIKRNPEIIQMCEELFIQLAWNGPQKDNVRADFNMIKAELGSQRYDNVATMQSIASDSLAPSWTQCEHCRLRFVTRREMIPPPLDEKKDEWDYVILAHGGDEFYRFSFCPNCGKKMTRPHSKSAATLPATAASDELSDIENHMAGKLKIQAGKLKLHSSRWVVLNGKFLYIFKNKDKEFPDTVFFIQGYFIQFVKNEHHNMHLIKLIPPSGANSRTASFYTSHEDEARKWTEKLELAAQTVSIEKFYDMGESLGKGSFAEVRTASEKDSGRKVAVKIIQKKVIDGKQKEYIRIEMSVMKLVNHPNVMKLEQVFETKTKIFMVMPLYTGGDLYEYMKQNARKGLDEDSVRQIIFQVLNALRYLHSVGIVHRDLKPENLLLKKEGVPTDVVITDFGLSKFAAPHEAMKAACGTLSYVAPEVLRMEGYGKEVDLWSTGVIMFLILRAKLPFYDNTKNRIIARILRQTPQMVDNKWKDISNETKDLIKKLLIKQPEKRITCDEAINHEFFDPIREEMRAKKKSKSPNLQAVSRSGGGNDTNSSIKSYENDEVFPASRSIKDIKYGDVDGHTLKQELHENQIVSNNDQQRSPINPPQRPAQLIKQNSIVKIQPQ